MPHQTLSRHQLRYVCHLTWKLFTENVTNATFFKALQIQNLKRKKWGDMAYYIPTVWQNGGTNPPSLPINCAHECRINNSSKCSSCYDPLVFMGPAVLCVIYYIRIEVIEANSYKRGPIFCTCYTENSFAESKLKFSLYLGICFCLKVIFTLYIVWNFEVIWF